MHNLAAAYATAGRTADAERLYQDGLTLAERGTEAGTSSSLRGGTTSPRSTSARDGTREAVDLFLPVTPRQEEDARVG